MRIGFHLPQVGGEVTARLLTALAGVCESNGFHVLWLSDHVVLPTIQESEYPYSLDGKFPNKSCEPYLEPIVTMSYLAAATSAIRLGFSVLVLPMRDPVLHAKLLATMDFLSGGRTVLGIGLGWSREEFQALSAEFADRGARLEE